MSRRIFWLWVVGDKILEEKSLWNIGRKLQCLVIFRLLLGGVRFLRLEFALSLRSHVRLFGTVFCLLLWTWQNNKELVRATHTHTWGLRSSRDQFFQKKQLIEFLALTFPDPYHGYRMIQVIFVSVLSIVNARERTQRAVFRLFSPQEALLIAVVAPRPEIYIYRIQWRISGCWNKVIKWQSRETTNWILHTFHSSGA